MAQLVATLFKFVHAPMRCNAMQLPRYDGGRVKLSLARLSFAYSCLKVGFFKKYSINVDIYICMSVYFYEHISYSYEHI
jgi:hypothetical protein